MWCLAAEKGERGNQLLDSIMRCVLLAVAVLLFSAPAHGADENQEKVLEMYATADDMWQDMTKKVCQARLKSKGNRELICDRMSKYVGETASSMLEQLAGAMSGSEEEVMQSAAATANLARFKEQLYDAIKSIGKKKKPSSSDFSAAWPKFTQFLMDVAMKKGSFGGGGNGINSLPPEALRNLAAQGIKIPGMESLNDFKLNMLLEPDEL
jgi:hypothetical protein